MYTKFEAFINTMCEDNIAYSESIKKMNPIVFNVVNNYVGQYVGINSLDNISHELSEDDIQLFIRCRNYGFLTITELENKFDIEIKGQPFEDDVSDILYSDFSRSDFDIQNYFD